VPFEPLSGDGETSIEGYVANLKALISNGAYEDSITLSHELLAVGLEGLRYLQTYDWLFLRTIVSFGYLGWIAYALTTVIDLHVLHGTSESHRTTASISVFSSILVALFSVILYQGSSWCYYFYVFFPVFFWEEVFARRKALIAGCKIVLGHVRSFSGCVSFRLQLVAFLGVLEALVCSPLSLSFLPWSGANAFWVPSYFHREIFTVGFTLAAFWPFAYDFQFLRTHVYLCGTWALGRLLMSIFTLFPVNKVEDISTITHGGVLMFLAGVLYLLFEDNILGWKSSKPRVNNVGSRVIMGCQVGMVLLALIVTRSSIASLQTREGLPFGN
jgi:phosphatidylinositol glycan class N